MSDASGRGKGVGRATIQNGSRRNRGNAVHNQVASVFIQFMNDKLAVNKVPLQSIIDFLKINLGGHPPL